MHHQDPTPSKGDLITILPGSATYSWAFHSRSATNSGPTELHTLVLSTHDGFASVLLPSGLRAWVHLGSCRLAQKAVTDPRCDPGDHPHPSSLAAIPSGDPPVPQDSTNPHPR